MNCETCHGVGNDTWMSPPLRNHPDQVVDTRSWFVACASLHDSRHSHAHMTTQTDPVLSAEACETCHGAAKEWDVRAVHKPR